MRSRRRKDRSLKYITSPHRTMRLISYHVKSRPDNKCHPSVVLMDWHSDYYTATLERTGQRVRSHGDLGPYGGPLEQGNRNPWLNHIAWEDRDAYPGFGLPYLTGDHHSTDVYFISQFRNVIGPKNMDRTMSGYIDPILTIGEEVIMDQNPRETSKMGLFSWTMPYEQECRYRLMEYS